MATNESSEKKKISREALRRSVGIFRYLRPHWFLFSIGLLLLAVSSILVILITALLGLLLVPGYSGELPGGAFTTSLLGLFDFTKELGSTGVTLAALVALLIIQGVFSFFRVYIFSFVTENAMLKLRQDTYGTIIRMPMQFFNERRIGDLASRISSDITSIQETLTVTLAEFIRQTIIIVVGVGVLVSYSYWLTLVMLASLPVIIVVMVIFGRYIRKVGKVTQDKVAESGVIVQETLTGIVNVKSFANESFESNRYSESTTTIRNFAMRSAVWRGMFGTFIIIFLFGALGLVIGTGAHLQETGQLSADVLPKFIMLTGLVAGSIGGLAAQMGTLQRSIGVIESVMEILSFHPEDSGPDAAGEKRELSGQLAFDQVTFHYPSRPDITVLDHVSFSAEAGQQIAIVGPSGSGKSTIAALVQRFYEPTSGRILLDGRDARELHLGHLRSQMAYVPQEVILFGGSIRDNIAYGRPGASEEDIETAARKANALEFIRSFPEGMNTLVGERGIQLSGGQRQRIAIARAVLRNPSILILDEATSSLDSESEKMVQGALDELMKGRTSIVIAHRLSTIRNAHRIVVVDAGRVRETGTHEELMAREDGVYRRLVELQFDKEGSSEAPSYL